VTDGASLDVQDLFDVPLSELRGVHEGTLPRLFGGPSVMPNHDD